LQKLIKCKQGSLFIQKRLEAKNELERELLFKEILEN